jgi:hypothetical protein
LNTIYLYLFFSKIMLLLIQVNRLSADLKRKVFPFLSILETLQI